MQVDVNSRRESLLGEVSYREGARWDSLAVEAMLSAGIACLLAWLLFWLGPPGSDFAAHAYQRSLFLEHGFSLWNNFWYSGRYSFVTYSLIYYPLAALIGIRLLAIATIGTATLAFAFLVGREWGPLARWSSRTFAVVWAGTVLSAAFPFALGMALALLALCALQAEARWRFAGLVVLTLMASPVAFLLLVVFLAALALARAGDRSRLVLAGVTVIACGLVELVIWRVFPGGGRYPFSFPELLAACTFCVIGGAITWRVEQAHVLRWVFPVYFVACAAVFFIPSGIGENVARLRYIALPIAVLALSLRNFRPRFVAFVVLILALSWNTAPLVASFNHGRSDPASNESYWMPTIQYLQSNLEPSYRVEAVDTVGHWPAVYLARANIPLARGWFRQDDFPQNDVLYSEMGAQAYLDWLRKLAVRYVVLTNAPPDYSAREEAKLLRSGHTGLRPVLETNDVTIYSVSSPHELVSGPGDPRVLALTQTELRLKLDQPGRYRLAVRYSPYWHAEDACFIEQKDGMMTLVARRAGVLRLDFSVNAGRALANLKGQQHKVCSS